MEKVYKTNVFNSKLSQKKSKYIAYFFANGLIQAMKKGTFLNNLKTMGQ